MPLTSEQIRDILHPKPKEVVFPRTAQEGPLRHWNQGRPCRGGEGKCKSVTYLTVDGEPNCLAHAARKLNEIIVRIQNDNGSA